MIKARHIEEASLNAWPALNSLLYDGWLLRFADGYTKRANSVTPLYASDLAASTKVGVCEALYRRQGLPPIFRLPAYAGMQELDVLLAARGYRQIDITSVQGRPLTAGEISMTAGAEVLVGEEGLSRWLDTFHAINPARRDVQTHKAILGRVIGRMCPLVLRHGDDFVACGLGILQGELLGLFDIVTRDSVRRRGYGRAVTESLLAWGRRQGAAYAYLQVMVDNEPAQRLYAGLDFSEQYRYWYRAARE